MNIHHRIISSMLFLLAIAAVANGSNLPLTSDSLRSGEQVRITAPHVAKGVVAGTLKSSDADTIFVAMRDDTAKTLGVPKILITGMEVQRGKKRQILMGALVGAAALSSLMVLGTSGEQDIFGLRTGVIIGAGMTGFLVGGVVGVFIKTEKWQSVRVESPPGTQIAGRIGFTINF